MRRWLAPWLILGQAIAAPVPPDPKLELRITQVHPADVIHLVADMRAQNFLLARPASEQRIDIPRQKISPLTLRQQMLNRLDMKVVQRGEIEVILPTCQRPAFQPVAFPGDRRITLNFSRIPAGAAIALVAGDAKLEMRENARMPDVDLLIRIQNATLSDVATSIAAAVDMDLTVTGSYIELQPRKPDPKCPASRFEQITAKEIPKRSKAELAGTNYSQTECGRLRKFPESKEIPCLWYESFPLSKFKVRGFIALSDRGAVMAIVEAPQSPLSREFKGSRISEDFVAFSGVTRESVNLVRFEYRDGKLAAAEALRVPMETGIPEPDEEAPLPSRLPARPFVTEHYPLEELRIEEIGVRDGQKEILLRDVNGGKMRARVGFYLGINDGRIIEIDDNGITVLEIVPDGLGGYREKEARMIKGQWYEDPRVALARKLAAPVNASPAQLEFIRAALEGNVEKLAALAGNGAEVDARLPEEGRNALLIAAIRGHLLAVRWLLANGARPDLLLGADESTALQAAVFTENLAVTRALLDAGADVNLADAKARTPLLEAAGAGFTELVDELIRRGANPRLPSNLGITPFTSAAANGHDGCVKRLLGAGVKIDERDASGYTMLVAAILRGRTATVRLLLERGANVNFEAPDGQRPLDVAIEDGADEELVALLRARGAKPGRKK